MTYTGNWKREGGCILIETVQHGYVPAPLTEDAPSLAIDAHFRRIGYRGHHREVKA